MFKDSFKYYKTKWPIPDMKDVIVLGENKHQEKFRSFNVNEDELHLPCSEAPLTLKPIHEWHLYNFADHPGLIAINNVFTQRGQRYWIARCLRDYNKHPNRNNLNVHAKILIKDASKDWWTSLQQLSNEYEMQYLKNSMRWSTLGYHHDWDTKIYKDDLRSEFPHDLSELCSYIAQAIGYKDFNAEAAIVNYYPIGSTLAGHTDHSENNLEAPLFSLSFGQSAIFLIGGPTRSQKPSAILLESGNVLIMSQESRLCYHAVPRIMRTSRELWNEPLDHFTINEFKCKDLKSCTSLDRNLYQNVANNEFWLPYKKYLHDCRINVNVRQVLKPGQRCLLQTSDRNKAKQIK